MKDVTKVAIASLTITLTMPTFFLYNSSLASVPATLLLLLSIISFLYFKKWDIAFPIIATFISFVLLASSIYVIDKMIIHISLLTLLLSSLIIIKTNY